MRIAATGAQLGSLTILAGGAIAAGTALLDYRLVETGLNGTGGALLVLGSGLLMMLGAILLLRQPRRGAAWLLLALLLLDIVGTSVAAWFMESGAIVAAMAVAAVGWLWRLFRPGLPAVPAGRGAMLVGGALVGVAAIAAGIMLPARSGGGGVLTPAGPTAPWDDFNGDRMAQKFSAATQITPANVAGLRVAWSLHTGDVSPGRGRDDPKTAWQSTPLFANNLVYVSTPFYRIFAVEPDSGHVRWIYDARPAHASKFHGKNRGITYWASSAPIPGQPCQKRLYIGTVDGLLHAVDADTGRRCQDFGQQGVLDVNQWNVINPKFPLELNQSVAVYRDTLVVGWAGVDWTYQDSPPGTVFGIDARTGARKWEFQTIPEAMRHRIGTANVWASMSVDAKAGLVYLPVSSPENNYYGGDRRADIPYATSITALHADTGTVAWSRQLVHHDIWDYDTNSAPTLVDVNRNGQTVPALVQSSKQGFLYVLNRLTGEPVYPIVERPVPPSDVPGEHASPTQPFVPWPQPTIPDRFTGISRLADWASLGQCSRDRRRYVEGGLFKPPSLRGTITAPATVGGVEWGGGAVDPAHQIYVVNSSNVAQIYQLIPRAEVAGQAAEAARRGPRPDAGWRAPGYGSPYGVRIATFFNRWGMPCWNPPYGTMSAYDLKTGRRLWQRPFGQVQHWGFYMPESWGSVTIGGPAITASGLIFIGASMDSRVRAVDLWTGKILWKQRVDAPAVATPAIYTYKGRQYVLFAAGGNGLLAPRVGDQLVAFALPGTLR
ncbi:pyrroloquinoline quinone-dependent dehydrogenase [Sphingomonas quercus]|uniref:Pyrroloquinoline quinone-dependent dehydrogenase n=1 Tax=Sphingomonas quercus TaxID=2842451 RepID=A0ABS6BKF9_9SPHN|nr:pyrroloquinoline quinone-dependent dehydrogenase [Sphingomonas quercus]MBU3078788.1 pyrroloquinoline quinone-dependent dehydrogenase [Sphingomonas quercus]